MLSVCESLIGAPPSSVTILASLNLMLGPRSKNGMEVRSAVLVRSGTGARVLDGGTLSRGAPPVLAALPDREAVPDDAVPTAS